jgi:hypothetical protein
VKKKFFIGAAILVMPALLLAAAVLGYQDWQIISSAPANPASGYLRLWADSTAGAFKYLNSSGTSYTITATVASGTLALGTSSIASGACASAVTATATGTLTTDAVTASFNSDPTAVTGYVPSISGMLAIIIYPTSNTVNAKVCNNTGSAITPGAITLNWKVTR